VTGFSSCFYRGSAEVDELVGDVDDWSLGGVLLWNSMARGMRGPVHV
jgi:hypothetical protein